MRLHLRRLIPGCTILTVVLFVGGIHVYRDTKHDYKQHNILRSAKNHLAKDIFWTKDSGVTNNSQQTHTRDSKRLHENHHGADMEWRELKAQVFRETKPGVVSKFNLNTHASDMLPLNRDVPDSRPKGCLLLEYPGSLPTTSVVIPFHNEWPSILLRTVHSLIDRTPTQLLKEIILVDDASELEELKTRLYNYIKWTFPGHLVRLIRLPTRQGLIRARLAGLDEVTGEVVSFFDSHMEVNDRWLEPLLHEIVKDRSTIAMGQLDYINQYDLKYEFYPGYSSRYGFSWNMEFFETYFRPDQKRGKKDTDPTSGVLMVGPAFAVDVKYFRSIGTYDAGMSIWGGENVELAWRVWMCGGSLVHVPCSRVGHIERNQPYSFPGGREHTEMINYKRAVDVWMGDYRQYVYSVFPGMKSLDAGDLTERLHLRDSLKCHNFTWFLENIWPELLPYKESAVTWGRLRSSVGDLCLDNGGYVFMSPTQLNLAQCERKGLLNQGFSLMKDGRLRTTLHCVVVKTKGQDMLPCIQNCRLKKPSPWDSWEFTEASQLRGRKSNLCLQVLGQQVKGHKGHKVRDQTQLLMLPCDSSLPSQKWSFDAKGLMEEL